MKIKKIELTNIKSFKNKTEIRFNNGVNIFIGPNAGGKSNLLEIIQSFFNDLILEQISISDNDKPPKERLFKIEPASSNRGNAIIAVFDKFVGNEEAIQEVLLLLEIEKDDIDNIANFKQVADKLVKFEQRLFAGTTIQNYISEVDLSLDFGTLVGQELTIRFMNHSLVEPENTSTHPFGAFYKFLKFSNAFFNFYNFYIDENSDEEIYKFRPYMLYFPPSRQHVNLEVEQTVELSGGSDYNRNFFKQTNTNQYQPLDTWSYLTWLLAYNKHLEREGSNDFFKNLLNSIVGIDFSIERIPPKRKNKYKINFSRINNSPSVKLSSGEDEFVSFISTLFVHHIRNGICIVDEPELHLHPRWQKKIIELFNRASEDRKLQFLMATHSSKFVSVYNLRELIRVHKKTEDNSSAVEMPSKEQIENTNVRHIIKVITATNNEKAFFADKVMLVEGVVDRIIFESLIKRLAGEDEEIIEVIDVSGKHEFENYKEIFGIWDIPTYIIADFGYIKQINPSLYKKAKEISLKKLKIALKEESKDTQSLANLVCKVAESDFDSFPEKDFKSLQSLCLYLIERHSVLAENLSKTVRKDVNEFIQSKYTEGIFVLREGEIEDYFGQKIKLNIEDAVKIAEEIEKGRASIPKEISEIVKGIINNV